MTYNVFSGMLNPTQSINQSDFFSPCMEVFNCLCIMNILQIGLSALTLLVGHQEEHLACKN